MSWPNSKVPLMKGGHLFPLRCVICTVVFQLDNSPDNVLWFLLGESISQRPGHGSEDFAQQPWGWCQQGGRSTADVGSLCRSHPEGIPPVPCILSRSFCYCCTFIPCLLARLNQIKGKSRIPADFWFRPGPSSFKV